MLATALALPAASGCSGFFGSEPTDDTSKALADVTVSTAHGEDTKLAKGATRQLFATARYADDTTKDVTADPAVVWSSSDPAIASVGATGIVTAEAAGSVTIHAAYKGPSGSLPIDVTP